MDGIPSRVGTGGGNPDDPRLVVSFLTDPDRVARLDLSVLDD